MYRIAALGAFRAGSHQHCRIKLMDLLKTTELPKLIEAMPHEKGTDCVTHCLRPSSLIRLIYNHNRTQFGRIFGANQRKIKRFWEGLFASPDGRDFKLLHMSHMSLKPE